MNMEKIKEFVRLAEEVKTEGVYGFHMDHNELHVGLGKLKELDQLSIAERENGGSFPYEISYSGEGFKLFALAKLEDIKEMPQFKAYVKAELLKQLAELENEEEVIA